MPEWFRDGIDLLKLFVLQIEIMTDSLETVNIWANNKLLCFRVTIWDIKFERIWKWYMTTLSLDSIPVVIIDKRIKI